MNMGPVQSLHHMLRVRCRISTVKSLMPNAECLPYTECPGPKRRNALYLTRFECMRIAYINSIYSEVQLYDIPRPLPLRPLRSCYPLPNISPPAHCCTTQLLNAGKSLPSLITSFVTWSSAMPWSSVDKMSAALLLLIISLCLLASVVL